MTRNASPLARDEQIHSITVFSGWATADGNVGGTTIVDAKLVGLNDFVTGKGVLIMSGPCQWELQTASGFVPGTGTITIPAFSAQITAGTLYRIITISPSSAAAGIAALQADVGDASASTLGSLYAILGNPAASLATQLATIAGYLDTEIAAILAAVDTEVAAILADTDSIDTPTGILHEQADAAVTINATNAAETDVLLLNAATTRYLVRSLRLKCADPGANTVTVRLYELVNDVLTEVDNFAISVANFAGYHSLMDMFGLAHLAGDQLQVTVRASAGGPYAITGQYSHAKTNA